MLKNASLHIMYNHVKRTGKWSIVGMIIKADMWTTSVKKSPILITITTPPNDSIRLIQSLQLCSTTCDSRLTQHLPVTLYPPLKWLPDINTQFVTHPMNIIRTLPLWPMRVGWVTWCVITLSVQLSVIQGLDRYHLQWGCCTVLRGNSDST